jgi:excinuclease UvrABC helicase subunit UvrB
MKQTAAEKIQDEYNKTHGITPTGINRAVEGQDADTDLPEEAKRAKLDLKKIPKDEYGSLVKDLTAHRWTWLPPTSSSSKPPNSATS